jgi:hypothetical protein
MASGGYHPPSNPASVSGPGQLSQRTDRPQPMQNLSNPKYGEQKDFHEIQSGAPMSAPPSPATGAGAASVAAPTPLSQPSGRPGEPVTSGAALGAGAGTEALNLPASSTRQSLREMYGPILPALIAESQGRYATQEFKDAVAALIAIM